MSKADKNIGCYDCSKPISGKKAFECQDCGELYCTDHIKLNNKDHSAICLSCFRKKIHLEVTLEMESESLAASTQLNTLKEKLKNCKKDLSNKKTTIERHQNQIKINEKTYLRKFENTEKKIEEETQRGENIEKTSENFSITLKDCKDGEIEAKNKLELTSNESNSVLFELELLKQENNKLKGDIQVANIKSRGIVPYSRLRNTLCAGCKNKVKLAFKEEIMEGNKDRSSVVQSVLAEKEKFLIKKSQNLGIAEPDHSKQKEDKACCNLF